MITYVTANGLGTDQSTEIHNSLDAMSAPGIFVVGPGVVWDYALVTHPDNIVIFDTSGYDWDNDIAESAQIRVISKTTTPRSKNAYEFILSSDWNPAIVLDNTEAYDSSDPQPQESVVFREAGEPRFQLVSEYYGGNPLFAFKNNAVEPDEAVFEILGVAGSPVAFKTTPSSGVAYQFADPVDQDMLFKLFSQGANDIIIFLVHGSTEQWRITAVNSDGSLKFESRTGGTKSFTFYPDGSWKDGSGLKHYRGTAAGAGKPASATAGDQYIYTDPSPSGFIGEVCTQSGIPGTWKTFGVISS